MYQRKRGSGRFYPTRLALNIASGESKGGGGEGGGEGFIVAETNYRVYAYTDSSLQIALLGLFTEIMYRYCIVLHIAVKCCTLLYSVAHCCIVLHIAVKCCTLL